MGWNHQVDKGLRRSRSVRMNCGLIFWLQDGWNMVDHFSLHSSNHDNGNIDLFFKMYIFSIEKSGLSIAIDSLPEWINMRLPKILPLFLVASQPGGDCSSRPGIPWRNPCTDTRGIQRQAKDRQIRGLGETGIGWSKDTYLFKRMVIGFFSLKVDDF